MEKCCKQLKKILSDDVYDRWIAVIEPLEIVENTLFLAVANDFYKDWLEENYLPLINKSLVLICDENVTAKINVDTNKFDNLKDDSKINQQNISPLTIGAKIKIKPNLNPNYTFDSFVIGINNQFAHAAAMAAATSTSELTIHYLFMVMLGWEKLI